MATAPESPYSVSLVAPGDPRYAEVLEFLYHEAELLDTGAFEEWLELVTEDAEYRILMPQNQRRHTEHPAEPIPIFLDNYASLRVRVRRLGTTYAWAEDPPSRTRHHVTNVRIRETAHADELAVRSYFLVYRNRSTLPTADFYSGERQDVLRHTPQGWRLARRVATLDQAVLGARNVSVLL